VENVVLVKQYGTEQVDIKSINMARDIREIARQITVALGFFNDKLDPIKVG